MNKKYSSYLLTLIASLLFCLWRSPDTLAAETVSFRYSQLEFKIPVDFVENYARTGKIDRHLKTYLQGSTPQELAELRKILTYRFFKLANSDRKNR